MSDIRYSVRINTIKHSKLRGVDVEKKNSSVVLSSNGEERFSVVLMPFDGGEATATWGRLKFKCEKSEDTAFFVYVAADDEYFDMQRLDESESFPLLKDRLGCSVHNNAEDLCLYELNGRYLYVAIVAKSQAQMQISISDIVVDRIGDNFMQTFPAIFQERNSFFHRYISLFSSLYNDMEEEIDDLPKLLDLDTCPKELLPVYSLWLGIDLGENLFEEDIARQLVKEAYQLNRMKGTRWCLERITKILLGETAYIVERNQMSSYLNPKQIEEYDRVYGNSEYDVTLLLKTTLTPVMRSQLKFVIEQFIPIRTSLHIVELGGAKSLDAHSYLDINATVFETADGILDNSNLIDTNIILQ